MRKINVILLLIMLFVLTANSQCFFNKIYGTYPGVFNAAHTSIQTYDGGFISVGKSYITQQTDGTYILKVNACGDTLWQKIYDFNPGSCCEDGKSIIQLKDSAYVICGIYRDSIEQATNIYLLKINKIGQIIWFKSINVGFNDRGVMHKQTSDGGFIIGGYYNVLNSKVFLIKTDSVGNIQWQHNYAVDSLENILYSIDITADGGFVLGGYYKKNSNQRNHLFLIKTDSLGIKKWAKSYGISSANEYKGFVVSTLDKGFVQVGYMGNSFLSRYIVKTDSNGIVKWQKYFDWPFGSDVFQVVRQLPDSSYIVGGSFSDTIHPNNMPRILLMKLNKYGDSLWAKSYTYYGGGYQYGSGIADDYLTDVNLTSDGGFIISGYVINNNMPGQNDLLLIKTDSLGNTCQIDTVTYAGCSYQVFSYYNISGTITYSNTSNTPLSNVKLYLKQNGIIIDSTITNTSGTYLFNSKPSGTYTISTFTTKLWSNVTATDALIIDRHVAGLSILQEPKLSAADVNQSSNITSADALLVKLRVVTLINSFPSGDWYFNPQPIVVSNANVIMNFKGICYGDVNGSYIPANTKKKTNTK